MTLPVVFRPDAAADVLEARDYYDRQREGLGAEFADSLEQAVQLIGDRPELHAVVLRGARRTKLRRFPYVVYYRILADRIEVLAVLHGSRHSRTWKRRA